MNLQPLSLFTNEELSGGGGGKLSVDTAQLAVGAPRPHTESMAGDGAQGELFQSEPPEGAALSRGCLPSPDPTPVSQVLLGTVGKHLLKVCYGPVTIPGAHCNRD